MQVTNQITGVAVLVLGLLVGLVALLGPLSQIVIWVIKYLQKLFAGLVKVEPFSHKPTKEIRES